MLVYLVRHGQSRDRAENKRQSPSTPLSQLGNTQAQAVAKRLEGEIIDIIISSPLPRALETAEAISLKTNVPVTQNLLLREKELPSVYGKLSTDPLSLESIKQGEDNFQKLDWAYTDGDESFRSVLSRAFEFKTQLEQNYPGKNVLLVTHGFTIRCLVGACILGAGYSDPDMASLMRSISITNTGITLMEYERDRSRWYLRYLNDHLHLKPDDLKS